jgi:hypothetical protein
MSHIASHYIYKGNDYTEGEAPPPGQVGVEFIYTPSPELSREQALKNFGKLQRLAQKAYHIESAPDDE